jgi:hypothetical protein
MNILISGVPRILAPGGENMKGSLNKVYINVKFYLLKTNLCYFQGTKWYQSVSEGVITQNLNLRLYFNI